MANNKEAFSLLLDMSDWLTEYREKNPDVCTMDAAIAYHQKTGAKPLEMGRFLAVAKILGETWDTIPEAKPALNTGYARTWTGSLREQHQTVELENGRKIEVPSLIGPTEDGIPADGNPAYVDLEDPLAAQRAATYIVRDLPRHVEKRFEIMAAGKGDIVSAANKLHEAIDRLVAKFV